MGIIKKKIKDIIRNLVYDFGYHNTDHLYYLLNTRLKRTENFFLVQVGANDGKSFDPVYDFIKKNPKKIKGILLEPLEDFYKQLVVNYKNFPNIKLLQMAIHNTEKSMTIYRVHPDKLKDSPEWAKGISSFNKDHHLKSKTLSENILPVEVKCTNLNDLILKEGIKKIDFLCIDTEGYDSEILLNFNFNLYKPAIIHFEHGLSDRVMLPETFMKIIELLHSNQYDVMIEDYNVTAHLRNKLV
jgi:FkbM family methyltransferase